MSGRADERTRAKNEWTRAKKERANDYERADEQTSEQGLRTSKRANVEEEMEEEGAIIIIIFRSRPSRT